jgi:hypothetical protein
MRANFAGWVPTRKTISTADFNSLVGSESPSVDTAPLPSS